MATDSEPVGRIVVVVVTVPEYPEMTVTTEYGTSTMTVPRAVPVGNRVVVDGLDPPYAEVTVLY